MSIPAATARELVLEDIRTTLQAISVGSEYNYQPDKVTRIRGPFFFYLDASLDMMYFVEVGTTRHTLDTQDGLWVATMEVYIIGAKRYQTDNPNPVLRTGEQESTISSRIFGDVTKALLTTHTRNENARQTILTDDTPVDAPEIEEIIGWAAHEFRFDVEFEYQEDAP